MKKIVIIIVSIFMFLSCKTKPIEPIIINNKVIDSVFTQEKLFEQQLISQGVYDSMFLKIEDLQTENSIFNEQCNQEINRILSQVNFTKKSGDNEYSILYNQNKKQLEIIATMQKSINSNKIQEKQTQKSKEIKTEIPVEVPVYTNILTKWQKILIALGVAFPLFHIIKFAYKFKTFLP